MITGKYLMQNKNPQCYSLQAQNQLGGLSLLITGTVAKDTTSRLLFSHCHVPLGTSRLNCKEVVAGTGQSCLLGQKSGV